MLHCPSLVSTCQAFWSLSQLAKSRAYTSINTRTFEMSLHFPLHFFMFFIFFLRHFPFFSFIFSFYFSLFFSFLCSCFFFFENIFHFLFICVFILFLTFFGRTCAQMGVCWSQYGTVRSCVRLVVPQQNRGVRHDTHPLLAPGPSTQLEFCVPLEELFCNPHSDVVGCDRFVVAPSRWQCGHVWTS